MGSLFGKRGVIAGVPGSLTWATTAVGVGVNVGVAVATGVGVGVAVGTLAVAVGVSGVTVAVGKIGIVGIAVAVGLAGALLHPAHRPSASVSRSERHRIVIYIPSHITRDAIDVTQTTERSCRS